ncbi:MAG: AbrB/MazE/SpoVT family DNA-binding domain-containing protein [Patescibacteria group bacterium]|nr:AbrB/MazE/SpoVT family DNA-binding domain-containing protein [Patescibacteria group bacterium]MDE1988813.1 AbrB/MazE/SpoVT family DNA-binding domain-containing protein [Patescibacteria group bacterium]MDE2218156.1 AbrB/MazE/SpoVT family DNA-binding domain-containing protein [Patescibacteria group bacterium]
MENLQITRVMKVGSSLAIVIPVNILRALKIERGDQMTFGVYADDVICIRKIQQEDLLKLKPQNIQSQEYF